MKRSNLEWIISILYFISAGCFLATFFSKGMFWIYVAIALLIAASILKFFNSGKKQ
ncbi:MAG: hypothetical protein HUJ55_02700 [Ileibacterium sp.]|nr:hypothetical protein [Ileibacterium sp.]